MVRYAVPMRADVGLWRSTLADTQPQRDSGPDLLPQATHLVWEAPLLVTCASCVERRVGGRVVEGAQMRKADLDPVLATALARWMETMDPTHLPTSLVIRWFDEIQAGFTALDGPADPFEAAAIALFARDDGAAIVHSGLERAWRWRDDQLTQLTLDHTELELQPPANEYEIASQKLVPAGAFRRREPKDSWRVKPLDVRAGDVIVLASGVHATTLETDYISDAVGDTLAARPRVAGAQDVADRIGALAERVGEYANPGSGVSQHIHSRLALAVVWF